MACEFSLNRPERNRRGLDSAEKPLLINSFRHVYTNLSRQFFSNKKNIPEVCRFHGEMVGAIEKKDGTLSAKIMKSMLDHGERHLKEIVIKGRRSQ